MCFNWVYLLRSAGRRTEFSTLLEFINASEAREDDEEFKNAVDELFEELEKENQSILQSDNTRNISWLPERLRNLF